MSKIQQVSAIGTIELARRLRAHGLIDNASIRAIDPSLLESVNTLDAQGDIAHTYDAFFPESWIITLWQEAQKNHPESPTGFLIGKTIVRDAYGVLSGLIRFSDTLGQAVTTYLQNIQYVNESEQWHYSKDSRQITLAFSYPRHKPYPSNAVERSITAMYAMGCYLHGKKLPLHSVQFQRKAPTYQALLEAYFGCEVAFSASCNALILPAEVMDWPLQPPSALLDTSLTQGKSYLTILLRMSLQTKLNEKADTLLTPTFTNRVTTLLWEDMAHYSNSDHVASALHLSRATLYRKLNQEGTSFSSIRDAIRAELMTQHSGLKATELYELLGFSDVSSYYKARKRAQLTDYVTVKSRGDTGVGPESSN